MKYKGYSGDAFIQLKRDIFLNDKYKDMPYQCKWIYTVLTELEHKYTGKNEDFFFRSDKDLANDCGMSLATFKRYKKILVTYNDIIQTWRMHWYTNEDRTKKSEKAVTAYRLL